MKLQISESPFITLFSLALCRRAALSLYFSWHSSSEYTTVQLRYTELRMRILYAHILRIRLCQYVYMFAYIRAYMALCYAIPQVSLFKALFVKRIKRLAKFAYG